MGEFSSAAAGRDGIPVQFWNNDFRSQAAEFNIYTLLTNPVLLVFQLLVNFACYSRGVGASLVASLRLL